jgi:hypothetical protein
MSKEEQRSFEIYIEHFYQEVVKKIQKELLDRIEKWVDEHEYIDDGWVILSANELKDFIKKLRKGEGE